MCAAALKKIMLNEGSQTQKRTYRMSPLMSIVGKSMETK